jgi:hypothetical protein
MNSRSFTKGPTQFCDYVRSFIPFSLATILKSDLIVLLRCIHLHENTLQIIAKTLFKSALLPSFLC